MSSPLAQLYYVHLFWELETLIENDVSVTSYSKPYPFQIYILNHVLCYVFASGSTLLHLFWEFETLIEK